MSAAPDMLAQLEQLQAMIGELAPVASEPYAKRTLERARRRERELQAELRKIGVIVQLAEVA